MAALGMVESGDDDTAVGAVGEVSRYQIKPWIWKQYSQSEDYQNREIATWVATQHLTELRNDFKKRANREPDDFDLYVLWNAGPTYYGRIKFSQARVHSVIRERARRYANLSAAMELKLAKAQPPRGGAPIRQTRSTQKTAVLARSAQTPLTSSPSSLLTHPDKTKTEPLLPLLAFPEARASLHGPLVSILPVPMVAPASSPAPTAYPTQDQKPIFAVGGLKSP